MPRVIPPPDALTGAQLDDIQGDIWSKGFPKIYETYYFFSIVEDKSKQFAECLKKLVDHEPTPLISTLKKVRDDRTYISQKRADFAAAKSASTVEQGLKAPRIDLSNALIAFTYKGLETLQGSKGGKGSLKLNIVQKTDVVFWEGMSNDGKAGKAGEAKERRRTLNDPELDQWDTLFQNPDKIHGLLKIAGSGKEQVDQHLREIQEILGHGKFIEDLGGDSPPMPPMPPDMPPDKTTGSRVHGWTRPKHRGKEHFGYEDGISQPRIKGIDELEPTPSEGSRTNMNTLPHILIVSKHTHAEGGHKRPEWMYNGSFLVLRKLQQNVKAFEELTDQWETVNCESKEQMGAKLMGRYRNGDPIAVPECRQSRSPEPTTVNKTNDFGFNDEACPFSAHIRKTNIRTSFKSNDPDGRGHRTRIIRSGIAYGTDYEESTQNEPRGLLFACYQAHIEDGFLNMQAGWSNNTEFREGDPGHDPIIGQKNGKLKTNLTDKTHQTKVCIEFDQLVTLKGGEYFFVPSISALRGALAEV